MRKDDLSRHSFLLGCLLCSVEDWCLPAIKTEPLTSAGQTIPYLRHRSWSCGVGRWVRAPWSLRWSRQEQEWDIQWWMSGKSTNDNFCAGILRHNIEMCMHLEVSHMKSSSLNPLPFKSSTTLSSLSSDPTIYNQLWFDNSKQCEISPCILTGGFFNATMSRPRYNSSAWADLEKNPDPNRRIIAFMDTILIRSSSWIIPPTMELWKHQHNTLLQYAPTTLFQFQLWCHRGMVD